MTTDTMTNLQDLPAQYDHAAAQAKWYPRWQEAGYFHAEANDPRPPFTIVIPPPNVTGALHLGHALNNTLQDILCRMKRMQGFNVLWMPGTDHAGIATQAVVERRLLEDEGLSRHDLGREGLVERIWKWKDQYEARIIGQLKQLGCSCDWERTRFTLDDQCARAVRETFFKLFSDGKIYRGKRLVNWDTFLQTAVSDDEVKHEPVKGHFWHFNYPVVDPQPGEPTHVTIATTRPETMLGDTAVAVHPDPARQLDKVETELREKLTAAPAKEKADIEAQIEALGERRQTILPQLETLRNMAQRGVQLELPLTGRTIPLISDIWAKPDLGSGCVKITPAHDENDRQVWQRNPDIGSRDIMSPDGTLWGLITQPDGSRTSPVPEKYRGLKMHTTARKAVVEDMEKAGLLVEVEDRVIDLAHSDRSKTPIEPRETNQWFVKMDELAQSAMDAVTDGSVKIIPDRYAKSYLDWLSEKRDWPVGRQLWWGHRISIFHVTWVAQNALEKCKESLVSYLLSTGAAKGDFCIKKAQADAFEVCVRTTETEVALDCFIHRRSEYLRRLGEKMAERLEQEEFEDLSNIEFYMPEFPEARDYALELHKQIDDISHDEDVLDTWFSSALWPHSTMGWPDLTRNPPIIGEIQPHTGKNEVLAKFYPTTTLITSRDIITLWVARMVLMGEYNMGDIPFDEVYITPKILDGYGETMSKSKGNGVDPLDVIEKFGADALRFGIAYMTTDTQDVKLPVDFECPHCQAQFKQTKKNRRLPRIECEKCGEPFSTQWAESEDDQALPRGAVINEKFELGRNFCNKLWNASRFTLMNLEGYEAAPVDEADLLLEDRWLLSRLATVTGEVTAALETYRYADAARTLYGFAWDEFCSFYVEMTKARFNVSEQRGTAQRVIAHALDSLLRLLQPITPFVTEEVWQLLGQVAPERGVASTQAAVESVCLAAWPEVNADHIDQKIEEQFADFQAVMGAVREVRQSQNIPPKEAISFTVRCDDATTELLTPMKPYFESMARATALDFGPAAMPPERSASKSLAGMEVHVDISAFFDVDAERSRLTKERDQLAKFTKSIEGKLGNENFVSRAPAEVVEAERLKLAEAGEQLAAVKAALAKLT